MKFFVKMATVVGAMLALAAHAQTYPNKPVRLVISFTPGSSTDIIGRAVAAKLQEIWGQPVVAENRPGAGGTVGSEFVVRSDPDGYTLLANSSAHVANPGKLNFSSAGIGSGTHFNLEKLKLATAIDVVHVPYKGTPEAIGDTIANRVCCYWAPLNAALPHVNGGKAVALAVSSAQRSPLLPNVPSVAEQGYAGFDYTLWVGLWGPAKMPPELAAKINKDVNAALASPDLRERLTKLGTVPGNLTIPQFTDFVKKDLEETKRILDAAGIKPQ